MGLTKEMLRHDEYSPRLCEYEIETKIQLRSAMRLQRLNNEGINIRKSMPSQKLTTMQNDNE